ncbi:MULTISPECIES: acyl-CoA dehydrogenase family protein [unclassified Mycolicibacterium]|uniref:acyl-CoA dehydrogenase family protein n=1 Tax=unclassified Mycolicibacterium TaxID=2636767 RepID=UPI0012DFCB44|nr:MULTISPECIES: acyl-CoA dehydrogenase family protein [unclassified Mycolicibacterium]MUL80802.1 pimeloyl-CoA dehydrogenase small subunit [Mycolicibacterium sp. CBMA 329]MUL86569.1 pimeloyl-CoA dehydrogenase small subunit [Mycolicibacterium sp. CBMA 331]MUM01430.1 pimeloyl-CoA dehydrogenase small subunit [Mycolicibacterium sp. CBMA 334]MUM27235.1 pimeloyl-CoA dehydrogenase small subunit [Mycolicibacterium sp. CBMA 295]MUM36865.1 pimeloyl-CoA dehydrogenase small subunit [Mycolicibacterium sp. 
MDFNLTNEQELLRDGLTKFLAGRYDLASSRAAAKTGPGWQPEIWRGLADELGILGATLPEEAGGIGGGPVETMVIAEALGHALVIEPFVDTVVVAGGLLHRSGDAAAAALLEDVVAGSAVVALAATEATSGDNWRDVSTTARREDDQWVLIGTKVMAVSAPLATHLLVTARTSGERTGTDGISLFLIDIDSLATGFTTHQYRTVDDRTASDLTFENVRLPAGALLGTEGQAWPSLELARDEGAAAVCAEAVGGMRKVLADTVEYCKQRQQFGQPIGSFQALQHRMVDMHMEVEQASAAVYLAVLNLDAEPAQRAKAVSAAKATIGRAARFIGQNSVQLHGGMGMTEELAIGHYFKRLTTVQYEFGSTDYHVSRYAELTRA